jgi:hypothetical protein
LVERCGWLAVVVVELWAPGRLGGGRGEGGGLSGGFKLGGGAAGTGRDLRH